MIPSAPLVLEGDTDYSDPFDVRPDPRGRPHWETKSASTDCCSYMEPFEAQRIISGEMCHHWSSLEHFICLTKRENLGLDLDSVLLVQKCSTAR